MSYTKTILRNGEKILLNSSLTVKEKVNLSKFINSKTDLDYQRDFTRFADKKQ